MENEIIVHPNKKQKIENGENLGIKEKNNLSELNEVPGIDLSIDNKLEKCDNG